MNSYEGYDVIMKEMENKSEYHKETVERGHIIFWPGSQRMFHGHTTEPEEKQRIKIDRVHPLV